VFKRTFPESWNAHHDVWARQCFASNRECLLCCNVTCVPFFVMGVEKAVCLQLSCLQLSCLQISCCCNSHPVWSVPAPPQRTAHCGGRYPPPGPAIICALWSHSNLSPPHGSLVASHSHVNYCIAQSALVCACACVCGGGDLQQVAMLLRHKADVNAQALTKRTALHNAGAAGHLAVVKALLASNARVGTVDVSGMTPLHTVRGRPSCL
jgi:hypothetical protein